MDKTIVASAISAASGIVVALITVFHEDMKNLIFSSPVHNYLKGSWKCRWEATAPPGQPALQDEIKVERVRGASVRGKGNNADFGDYHLHGEADHFVVTLQYDGIDNNKGLVGVVILKKVTLAKLTGVWCQYSSDGSLKSGTTVWDKK